MEKFKAYLTVDDWKQTDLLPPGWFYRQKRTEKGFTYLNPMFEHFRTMIAMFDHLRQEGYGEEAVEKFERGFKTLPMEPVPLKPVKTLKDEPTEPKQVAVRKVKKEHDADSNKEEGVKDVLNTDTLEALLNECDDDDDDDSSEAEDEHTELGWQDEDEWLPPGWQVAVIKFGEMERRRYQSPCGRHFGGLADALAFLLEGGEGEDGIDCMTGGLALEGWVRVEAFSRAGWWSRQDAAGSTRFLSPQMEQLPGLKEVEVAMGNADYSKEQIHRFKELFGDQGVGDEEDDSLKNSSVHVKQEKGEERKTDNNKKRRKSPQTKRPSDATLERPKTKEARIEVKKEHSEMVAVKQEKVEEEETLPKGWKRHGEGLVSPQGKKFASMVAAVEWMIQNKATSDQIYQVGEGCLIKFFLLFPRSGWVWAARAGVWELRPRLFCREGGGSSGWKR